MSQKSDLWVNQNLDTVSGEGDNSPENATPERSLITLLCGSLAVLWKDQPKQMEVTELNAERGEFSLRGKCPHCKENSVFVLVTSAHSEALAMYIYRLAAGLQCQGCLKHILGIVLKRGGHNEQTTIGYLEHYPLGAPDDAVAEEVAAANQIIALDFAEALRCLWVKSYKASVAMCRRSVEAACKHFGATGRNLEKKIDNLAAQGKITESLREMAHAVRLSGNRGLHGKKRTSQGETPEAEKSNTQEAALDDLDLFGEDEAKAMIAFTKELFHHLFVMPALLEKYKPKPKGEASEAT